MINTIKEWEQEFLTFLLKIILPAIVGIAVRVGMMVEKEKITLLKIVLSLIVGLGFVYLLQKPVLSTIPTEYQPLTFGVIGMSGEYIGKGIINRFGIDSLIKKIFDKISIIMSDITGMQRIFKNLLSTIIGSGLVYVGVMNKFSDIIRVFLILLGIILIFSKDTLLNKIGDIIDGVLKYFRNNRQN